MNLIDRIIKIINRDKKTLYAAVFISFVVLFVIFYYVFLPALKQSRALSIKIKEKRTELTRTQIRTSEYKFLEDQIGKAKEQLGTLKKKILWERDISSFLNEVTKLASGLKIEFVNLKPESLSMFQQEGNKGPGRGARKAPADYLSAKIPIAATMRSTYSDLVSFLERVEEANKFITIDAIILESSSSDIYKHNIRMTLSIFVEDKG